MKKSIKTLLLASLFIAIGCKQNEQATSELTSETTEVQSGGQENVVDETSVPNIVQTAVGSKDHTTLVTAVKAAGLVETLSGEGPFTVFAPTNAAFSSLLTELNLPNLAAVPAATLENVLKYHVVAGANVLSTDITNNMNVTTFQGGTFKITTTGGVKITDANNRVSNVIATDVQCSNGVIHAIDKVLLP